MPQGDRYLHFGCPQCTARLKAPKSRAGSRGRCPWCQYVFTVPRESHFPGQVELYAIRSADWTPDEEAAWPTYIAVRCNLCGTWLVAVEEEAGQWIECPDCGTTTQVPARRQSPAEAPPAPPRPSEIYAIYEGPGQPPTSHSAVYTRYFPVFCRQCSTRMLATAEQVGQSLICPDCGTATPVPAPKEESPKDVPARPSEIYALRTSQDEGHTGREGSHQSHTFKCPRCGTRLHATADQVGQTLACPDCGEVITVPPRPPPAPSTPPRDESADIYELRPAEERPALDLPGFEQVPPPLGPPLAGPAEAARSSARQPTSRPISRTAATYPSNSPTSPQARSDRWDEPLGFLLSSGVRNLWLFLSVGLAFFFSSMGEAARLIPSGDGRLVFLGLVMLIFAGLVAVVIFVVGSAYLLTILQETAAGCDRIEEWPDNFLDYLLQGLGVVVAAAVAMGLSVGLDRLATDAGAPRGVLLAVGCFLLFPILLLCVLESGLPFMPFSVPIFRSIVAARPAWLGFYLRAAVLVGLAVAASVWGLALAGFWAILPAAAVLGAAVILYFRLLGRLASHASQRLADFDARRAKKTRKAADRSDAEDSQD